MGKATPIASDATRERRQLLSGAMRLKGQGFDRAAEQLAGQAELVKGAGGIMKQGDLERARADKAALQSLQDTKMAESLSPVTEFGINKTTGLAGLTAEAGNPLAARQQFFNEQVGAIRSNTFNPEEAKKKALSMGISETGWAAGLSRMPAVTGAVATPADKAAAELKDAADKAAKEKAAGKTI